MRSALICVFFTLVVHKDGSCADNDEDFRPTPIPLVDWPSERQTAGTLHEIIKTEAPPTPEAIPPHYWESALRHIVYLTIVRDKIDQLLQATTTNNKPENDLPKEIDDQDLWEKIKAARFDRLKEEPIPPGDVTLLARGRLLEDKEGYRFVEDDATKKNCSDADCAKGIVAQWSVKRVRQGEIVPGKYHYELTFAVTSQTNRKLKKPYENPVRTFTIKENAPTERPQARHSEPGQNYHQKERYNRATWIHKNINPAVSKRPTTYSRGLDRIFTSLFSDDDGYVEPSFKQKQKPFIPPIYPTQHSKVGYVDDRDPYHQKKILPYPMPKPQAFRYNHPPIPAPPVSYMHNPYIAVDPAGNTHYVPQYQENRYVPPPPPHIKTTRPAVLPTPIANYPLVKESTVEVSVKTKPNATEHTTKEPEVTTIHRTYIPPHSPPHNSQKPPMKVSYFPEHIRPPVYNAPPGVFVTMDKKPFKPMPPLKLVNSNKPQKAMPSDFRPSPQVLDTQFSDPDSIADTAFRPITMNYTDLSHNKKVKKEKNNIRTPLTAKKPPKKHDFIKSHRLTTATPDIITAHSSSVEDDSSMEWTNLLGAFTKTTPMASEREKDKDSSETSEVSSTSPSITTADDSYEDIEFSTTTKSTSTSTTSTTTTPKPKKRTRPPPKYTVKPDKIKKFKRVSTTTTTTTSTTVKPTRKLFTKKPSDDLTPQASSAATSGFNSVSKTPKEPSETTTTSTTSRPTTTKTTPSPTTISTSTTTVEPEQPVATPQPKRINRFRISTLMQKGTSVKHDKWSGATPEKNRTIPLTSSNNQRRKASKFQGYVPSSTRSPDTERDNAIHKDHAFNSQRENVNSTEQNSNTTPKSEEPAQSLSDALNELNEELEGDDEEENDDDMDAGEVDEVYGKDNENDIRETKDDNEYIFPTASSVHEVQSEDKIKDQSTTEVNLVVSPQTSQNKTKCKKKKHSNLTNIETSAESLNETEVPSSSTTTTESSASDIFNDLFGGFTMDDTTDKPATEKSTTASDITLSESEKHERYVQLDDDLEDFLHSLDQKSNHFSKDDKDKEEEEYNDDDIEEDSPFNNDEENFDSRQNDDYYEEQESQDRPLSLLELMAME